VGEEGRNCYLFHSEIRRWENYTSKYSLFI